MVKLRVLSRPKLGFQALDSKFQMSGVALIFEADRWNKPEFFGFAQSMLKGTAIDQ